MKCNIFLQNSSNDLKKLKLLPLRCCAVYEREREREKWRRANWIIRCDSKQFGTLINFNFILWGMTIFFIIILRIATISFAPYRMNMKERPSVKIHLRANKKVLPKKNNRTTKKFCLVISPNKDVQVVDLNTDKIWKTYT